MTDKYIIPTPVSAASVESHTAALDTRMEQERNKTFTISASYVNGTNFNIIATQRNGLAVTIKPSSTIHTGEFHIFFNYRIGGLAALTPDSIIRQAQERLPDDLKCIRVCLERLNKLDKHVFGDCVTSFDIVYKIPSDLFVNYNGAIHITDLGLTLSTVRDDNAIVVNPDSLLGRELLEGETPSIPGLAYRVEINDPDKRYGVRYLNLSGRIFRIDPTTDHTKVEGVYVHTNAIEVRPVDKIKSRYDFCEADEALKLYRTYEDALHHGDQASQQLRDFENEKHKLRMDAIEAEKEKQTVTNQTALTKSLLERFAQMENNSQKQFELYIDGQKKLEEQRDERARRERDEVQAQRASERSEREAERKEQLEYIKWCTTAVAALATLFVVISKPNKKQFS